RAEKRRRLLRIHRRHAHCADFVREGRKEARYAFGIQRYLPEAAQAVDEKTFDVSRAEHVEQARSERIRHQLDRCLPSNVDEVLFVMSSDFQPQSSTPRDKP